jgi:putative CocE/NonD family hydrolase
LERPFHELHHEILRWYDYWLKDIDTGIMNEPPVKIWVMGANKWLYAEDWPLPETKWIKFYLRSWERLSLDPPKSSSFEEQEAPDAFVQMPPTQTRTIQKLRYMTAPLPEDRLVIGPSALYLYASIDQEDTNWIVILKDVGPDVSVRTAREGEREVPTNISERELTRGWLKASHRAIDPKRSKPWKPWHPLTRKAWKPVKPREINEYAIELLPTANLFKAEHRICLEITSLDMPTGVAGFTNVEYIPYHICSSKTTLHKIYHNQKYPSHILLPVIPKHEKLLAHTNSSMNSSS